MKTTSQFLSELSSLGVRIWDEDNRVRYQAPKGILTPDLLSQLRDRQPEILSLLQTATERRIDVVISPVSRAKHIPLSFAQQRLWFLDRLEGQNATYNLLLALRLEGYCDLQALRQALQTIGERHETLRTYFTDIEGVPVQIVVPQVEIDLPIVNLANLSASECELQLEDLARQELDRPFDLAIAPLFRAKLLLKSETDRVLLLTLHHIISDGWSMGILKHELSMLYRDAISGRSPSLSPLPIQYVDFAYWQRKHLQGEVLERQINYWKTQLAALPSRLELPTDKPRPAIQSFRGQTQEIQLPLALTQQLKNFSQQSGVTLFMTLLTAFGVLLSRYSSAEDIAIGSPIANRQYPEIEHSIGFFANTLVMRIDLTGNPSFADLLDRVRQVALDAYTHQDLPFEKLVEELQPERQLSHHPLFQVMFALQNAPHTNNLELPDLKVRTIEIEGKTAKFDLTLSMRETEAGLRGVWESNTDLFAADTIQRMAGHLETLLAGLLADPSQPIQQLPLLTAAESQQLLVEWNDTQVDYELDLGIHQLFEAQVALNPAAVAVVCAGQQLTYRELNDRSNRVARHLQELGVSANVLVGICVERSVNTIVGLLGILKAGGAYVPLDPAYPSARLAAMLSDSQLSVLVTQQDLECCLPAHSARVVCLDRDWQQIERQAATNLATTTRSTDLAYTIYTSGSTGRPKGVQIQHRAVVNFLNAMRRQPGLTERDILLSVTTISFDIAVLELYLPLSVGAKIVLASREIAVDGRALLQLLTESGATAMQATPATWQLLLAAGWNGGSPLKILCGGEALAPDLADRLAARGTVWNLYGPTEATVWATIHPLDRSSGDRLESSISIGKPIDNIQAYILDSHLQPVPIGIPGELYLGGVGLAAGYLDRPDLTAQKFIPHPFSTEPQARLYKTGDLAKYLPTGDIKYLHRLDDLVKLRGVRIELGEIESLLATHPDVRAAVAMVREDLPGERRLVAYIIPVNLGATLLARDLHDFLAQKLPRQMMPSAWVIRSDFPLTPNGKIDRQALPAPDLGATDTSSYVAPRTATERQLAAIWTKLLKIESIGVNDNFFDLGGHSLLAVTMFAELDRQWGQKLPLVTLFQHQTIAELAAIIQQSIDDGDRTTSSSPAWKSLVRVKQGNPTKAPLFLIHDVSGSVLFYQQLANYLDSDRSVYILQPQGLDGNVRPIATVSEMATNYIDEIRQVQPVGSYYLGGYSFGSIVALEIATQLDKIGQKVELLAIVDTVAPRLLNSERAVGSIATTSASFKDRCSQVFSRLHKLFSFNWQRQNEYIRNGLRIHRTLGKLHTPYRFYLRYIKRSALELGSIDVYRTNHQAYKNYLASSTYPGTVTIFCSDEMLPRLVICPQLNWDRIVTGGVEICSIPGTNHATIIQDPYIKLLAEKLALKC